MAKVRILTRHLPSEAECRRLVSRKRANTSLEFEVASTTMLQLGDFARRFQSVQIYVEESSGNRPTRAANIDATLRHHRAGFLTFVDDMEAKAWNLLRLDFLIWPNKPPFTREDDETLAPQEAMEPSSQEPPLSESVLSISQKFAEATPRKRDGELASSRFDRRLEEAQGHRVITHYSAVSASSSPSRTLQIDHRKYVMGLMLLESKSEICLISCRNCSWWDVTPFTQMQPEGSALRESAISQHCEEVMDQFVLAHLDKEDLKKIDVTVLLSKAPCRLEGTKGHPSVHDCYEFFLKNTAKSWTRRFNFKSITLVVSDEMGPRPFPFDDENEFPGTLKPETLFKINSCRGSHSDGVVSATSFNELDQQLRSKIELIVQRTKNEVKHHHLHNSPRKQVQPERQSQLDPARRSLMAQFDSRNEV